ncbi:MAG: zinc-binding dehydrogenase [Lentisphaeria bacterium]|jgi:alcohol dehydrogenase|nr:zinc-binding dehydrogenase [Lentisphaeria bacterium]MDP7743081.1 zinc-binding dehydrogenase [Lentisphaeria bacterium]
MDSVLAAVFHGGDEAIELKQTPMPALPSGGVLVRVRCCTLCGSDIHTADGRRPAPTPLILGHEIIGDIVEIGGAVPVLDYRGQPLEVGQCVTWSVAVHCGDCFYCQHQLPQKCVDLLKYGHTSMEAPNPLTGGLAEYCQLMPGTTILPVPTGLPDETACPANCATATVVAAMRLAGDCAGAAILIHGAGTLGLTACALGRTRGAASVIVSDPDPRRREIARRFGATSCVGSDDTSELAQAVAAATSGRGVDAALDFSGATDAMAAGLDLLRTGGRLVMVGAVFPGPALPISPETVIRRMLTIHGLHNYAPVDLADAMTFLTDCSDRFPFSELVARTFPLTAVNEAFEYAARERPFRVAVRP